jgi:4-amino-4-deoxy-L-arabinose transferase-like glycosyltransferase
MQEPSVLDFVKERLTPWRKPTIQIPGADSLGVVVPVAPEPAETFDLEPQQVIRQAALRLPWRVVLGLLLPLAAQLTLEPPVDSLLLPVALYALSAMLILWGILAKEWVIPVLPEDSTAIVPLSLRAQSTRLFGREVPIPVLVYAVALGLIAFVLFGGNYFTPANIFFWALALAGVVWGLSALSDPTWNERLTAWAQAVRQPTWRFSIQPWTLLVLAAFLLAAFFRFYRLDQVPGEMFSDHAEKLLDVSDVIQGQTHIFFTRNTGREAFQFYLTAAVASIFGTGISFMSLKLGTALAGFFTLPFIYLLGKEIGSRWTGLTALLLAGVAYWPNVIARIGLRFPLYPLFVAPTLYFLVRGLRRRNRNDFIWSGLFLGIGLHGYSPIRLLPFVVIAAILVYLLHNQSQGNRAGAVWALAIVGLVSLFVFLPLLRYILEDPSGTFGYRAFSRLAQTERAYVAPVWQVFLSNTWKALVMPFYKNGNIWVHSVPNRPALDWITGGLYFIGLIVVIVRYIRQRHWIDLFLLVSIPLLMMPSILSLAFPEENPSLNRAGGAIVPVFIIAAMGLESALSSLLRRIPGLAGRVIVSALAVLLALGVFNHNYDLVFRQFDNQFMAGAWNTSEVGTVIRDFAGSQGSYDTAYVVPYPYWMDTRLVGINAGDPLKDFALWRENLPVTLGDPRA